MKDMTGQDVDAERPYLLLLLSGVGFLGCVCLIAGTLIAQQFVPDHDWVADTISDLAAGRWEILMDVALYGFAAGLFACALAAAHVHLGGIGWSAGILMLAILAALVVIIAARNEYGDRDNEGIELHIYLVYALGALFALTPFCLAPGLRRDARWASRATVVLGAVWLAAAPVFFFLPTGIDGLYERALGLIACGIVSVLCAVFWRRGRSRSGKARRDTAS